jgi:hypothetical protein
VSEILNFIPVSCSDETETGYIPTSILTEPVPLQFDSPVLSITFMDSITECCQLNAIGTGPAARIFNWVF